MVFMSEVRILTVYDYPFSSCVKYLDGFLEATLSPMRSPKPLKIVTLLLGLGVPIVLSAGIFIRLVGTVVGIITRFDR